MSDTYKQYANPNGLGGSVGGIGGGVYIGPTTSSAPTPLAVPHALESLDKSIAALYNEVDALGSRLQPVLQEPRVAGEPNQPPSNNSSVAGRVHTAAQAVAGLAAKLSELRSRLDL